MDQRHFIVMLLSVGLSSFLPFGSTSVLLDSANEMSFMFRNLLNSYDKRIPPINNGRPVNVTVQVFINDMVPFETLYMHYSADFFLRLTWSDYRLRNNSFPNETVVPMSGDATTLIWTPDIFLPAVKKGVVHNIPEANEGAQLYLNGTVVYSKRLSIVAFCPMELRYYPFDIQTCKFPILSYTYSNDFIRLNWNTEAAVSQQGDSDDLSMLEFNHVYYKTSKHVSTFGKLGAHDRLEIEFTFYRYFPFFFLRDFFPCILIVILSWVSFWIDFTSTPARVALGITTILTVVTMTNSIRGHSPPAGIFRSLDWYLLVCNLYVFAALGEYALVGLTYHQRKPEKKQMRTLTSRGLELELNNLSARNASGESTTDAIQNISQSKVAAKSTSSPKGKRQVQLVHRIDNVSKIIFPISFCIFNAIYFLFHRLSDQTVD